jgi:hypothetical protein
MPPCGIFRGPSTASPSRRADEKARSSESPSRPLLTPPWAASQAQRADEKGPLELPISYLASHLEEFLTTIQ